MMGPEETTMPRTSNTIRPTRYTGLGYREDFRGCWRIYDISEPGRQGAVGPKYRTKVELLADLDRYAREYGCEDALSKAAEVKAKSQGPGPLTIPKGHRRCIGELTLPGQSGERCENAVPWNQGSDYCDECQEEERTQRPRKVPAKPADPLLDAARQALAWLDNLAKALPPDVFMDACPNDFGRMTLRRVIEEAARPEGGS
jgi:hypothetical protein